MKSYISQNQLLNMIREFFTGFFQGVLIGMLLGAINVGFFGKVVLGIGIAIFGNQPFLGIVLSAVLNIGYYYMFSKKAVKENLIVFIIGLVCGIILL